MTELHYVIAALAAAPAAALLNLAALASDLGPERAAAIEATAVCPMNALALTLTLTLALALALALALTLTLTRTRTPDP